MAAQIFAPQFLILTTNNDTQVTINTNSINAIYPVHGGSSSHIFYDGNSVVVTRSYSDLNNDLAAKNCK
jgi:hypothetical protein